MHVHNGLASLQVLLCYVCNFLYSLICSCLFHIQNVPYQFATEHLPKCKVKIILRNLKGEGWTVNSIPTTKVQTSHTFCGGWLSFVRDNNIGIGDICIFELICKFELRVRILRVGKEGIDGHDSEAAHGGKNSGSTSVKVSRRKPKKTSENARNIKESGLCTQSNNCIVESGLKIIYPFYFQEIVVFLFF